METKPFHIKDEKRKIWAFTRSFLETDRYKHKRYGGKSKSHWEFFEHSAMVFGYLLRIVGLYKKGYQNAMTVMVKEVDLPMDSLPSVFDNYKILHLTDFHLDCVTGIEDVICEKIKNLDYDLCLTTGDYREKTHGGFKQVLNPIKKIVTTIKARDGIWGVLGNHDSYSMVDYLEEMGIKILTNETVFIEKDNEKIAVTGIDDPHYYYTDQATVALEEEVDGFKIALVHSPELFDIAADNGYKFYLCGHTHGGQICLPGGIPLITHLYDARQFCKGLWKYKEMLGYTSQGCGAVAIPIRFNSCSEITLFTLKNKED